MVESNKPYQKPVDGTTLYDRLGGDAVVPALAISFLDELVETPVLKPFFKDVSVFALKTHQVKLFRVVFGKEDEKPDEGEFFDFMLKTHTRLFRDDLNETHFDLTMECFEAACRTFRMHQTMIDECMAILLPLRAVFEYGAKIAAQEKDMNAEELTKLPVASSTTIGTETPVRLPEYSKVDIPDWLPEALGGSTTDPSIVRAWTCELTDCFGPEGDAKIAATFMDQPYMDHHVYLVAFLELAFLPDDVPSDFRKEILNVVKFPRGYDKPPLSRALFKRMIDQFVSICDMKGLPRSAALNAEKKLHSYRHEFAEKTCKADGVNGPHILRKVGNAKPKLTQFEIRVTHVPVKELEANDIDESLSSKETASLTSRGSVSASNSKVEKKTGFMKRLFVRNKA